MVVAAVGGGPWKDSTSDEAARDEKESRQPHGRREGKRPCAEYLDHRLALNP
jgi:hypothetical protein